MRSVKNKGAITVLELSYLVMSALYLLLAANVNSYELPYHQVRLLTFAITTSL